MRKIIGLLLLSSFAMADITADGSNTFDNDSKQVVIGSSTITQVMTVDSFITRSYLINPSTWTSVCISSYAATVAVSTTTSPSIPPNTVFSVDGPTVPWWGSLWATSCNAIGGVIGSSITISVLRTK